MSETAQYITPKSKYYILKVNTFYLRVKSFTRN